MTDAASILAGINAHDTGDAVSTIPQIGGDGEYTLPAKQRRADESTAVTTLSQWVDDSGNVWPIPIYPSDDSSAAQESSEYFEFLSGMLSLPGSYSAEAASILSGMTVSHHVSVATITGPQPTSAPGKRDVEDTEDRNLEKRQSEPTGSLPYSFITIVTTEEIWVDPSGSPWGVPVY